MLESFSVSEWGAIGSKLALLFFEPLLVPELGKLEPKKKEGYLRNQGEYTYTEGLRRMKTIEMRKVKTNPYANTRVLLVCEKSNRLQVKDGNDDDNDDFGVKWSDIVGITEN